MMIHFYFLISASGKANNLSYEEKCFDWKFIVGFKVSNGGPVVSPTFGAAKWAS